jgi:hypothetical protein
MRLGLWGWVYLRRGAIREEARQFDEGTALFLRVDQLRGDLLGPTQAGKDATTHSGYQCDRR